MTRRQLWPIIRKVWISVGIGVTIIFTVWSVIGYRANREAKDAWQSDDAVNIESDAEGLWRVTPVGTPIANVRLVFFPGSLVDPVAYAPLLRAVAAAGYQVTLVELPRRGSFGGAESVELRYRIAQALDESGVYRSIVIGGHSRGAVVASSIASSNQDIDGLVLIGSSHPRDVDLSELTIPVAKIVGTRDGLASPKEVKSNAALLPQHTAWTWIEGGNHSQFGWYGFQPMDRRARVSAATQRAEMIEQVLKLMKEVAERETRPDSHRL